MFWPTSFVCSLFMSVCNVSPVNPYGQGIVSTFICMTVKAAIINIFIFIMHHMTTFMLKGLFITKPTLNFHPTVVVLRFKFLLF